VANDGKSPYELIKQNHRTLIAFSKIKAAQQQHDSISDSPARDRMANCAFMDGSVHFVSKTIAVESFKATETMLH
jgi:prepilin-type processing-associated H-X9-DG protein